MNYYIYIVVRSLKNFYNDRMKFLIFTQLCLHLTFIWYLILKFYVVLFPSPVGKVQNNKISIKLRLKLGLKIRIVLQKHFLITLAT